MNLFKRLLIIGGLSAALVMPFAPVQAQGIFNSIRSGLTDTSTKAGVGDVALNKSGGAQTRLTKLVGGFINTAIQILGVIAVILIVYAGGLWLTASGNDQRVATAKKIIISVVIGVIVASSAYGISVFVLRVAILGQSGL